MDAAKFDQELGDLAAVLGDPTRRGIYITVRESPEPMTTAQIADLFEIHANVARHHLDRLVTDGYLRVTHRRRTTRVGPGAGRPAKHYEPTSKDVSVQFPAHRHDLLANMLLDVISQLDTKRAAELAEEVGREAGRKLAAEIGMPEESGFEVAARAVAGALMGIGFETEALQGGHRLVTRFCPFGETATKHPEIVCRLDQGLVEGLLESTRPGTVALVTPHRNLDECCFTDI